MFAMTLFTSRKMMRQNPSFLMTDFKNIKNVADFSITHGNIIGKHKKILHFGKTSILID
jgi:hypothetical protein